MSIDITPLSAEGAQLIDSYGPGRFKIAGVDYFSSLIVFETKVIEWDVQDFQQMTFESFTPLIEVADALDMVLLGCGARAEFVPPALRQKLRDHGIILDFMETGAACRTHNFLLTEGRRVASALIVMS